VGHNLTFSLNLSKLRLHSLLLHTIYCQNLRKELLNNVLLTIYLPTVCWILSNLPVSNIILLKQVVSPFMIISSKSSTNHLPHTSWHICCFWYIILFFLNVYHPGLAFLPLLSVGSNHIYLCDQCLLGDSITEVK